AGAALPTLTLPKASEAVSVAAGAAAAAAVPASATVTTPPAASCEIVKAPLRAPRLPLAGRKTIEIVQAAPAARLVPALQVPPAIAKSLPVPSESAETRSAALPLLVSVAFCAAL